MPATRAIGVTIRGGKRLRQFTRRALAANDAVVQVGFFPEDTYPDGTPVAFIASVHNFGSPSAKIPQRPFFDRAIEDMKNDVKQLSRRELRGALRRNVVGLGAGGFHVITPDGAKRVGDAASATVKKHIVALSVPPNVPSVVKRKKTANPLIDTKRMLSSVKSKVVKT